MSDVVVCSSEDTWSTAKPGRQLVPLKPVRPYLRWSEVMGEVPPDASPWERRIRQAPFVKQTACVVRLITPKDPNISYFDVLLSPARCGWFTAHPEVAPFLVTSQLGTMRPLFGDQFGFPLQIDSSQSSSTTSAWSSCIDRPFNVYN